MRSKKNERTGERIRMCQKLFGHHFSFRLLAIFVFFRGVISNILSEKRLVRNSALDWIYYSQISKVTGLKKLPL